MTAREDRSRKGGEGDVGEGGGGEGGGGEGGGWCGHAPCLSWGQPPVINLQHAEYNTLIILSIHASLHQHAP